MSTEVHALRERAKELRCLYRVQEAVSDRTKPPPNVFLQILNAIPDGWQHPDTTGGRIEYLGRNYVGPGYSSDGARLLSIIRLGNTNVGFIEVVASLTPDSAFVTPPSAQQSTVESFLPEERQLLDTIAKRISEYLEWKHTQLLGERSPGMPEHWRWREEYALALLAELDRERFGVSRVLLGGSTASGEAGVGSDIDLYVDFHGTDVQRRELTLWIEGWSLCLAELASRQTGYRINGGLIDLNWIDSQTDPRLLLDLRELHP